MKSNCPRYQSEFSSGIETSKLNAVNVSKIYRYVTVSTFGYVDCRIRYDVLIVSKLLFLFVSLVHCDL